MFKYLTPIIFLIAFASFDAYAVTLVGKTWSNPDCGSGKANTDGCPYVPIGNCDGAQGSAVAIDMYATLPQDTGRFLSFAASSQDTTFLLHDSTAPPVTWSTRYVRGEVGTPPNRVEVGDKSIDEFVIETLPANGTLWDGATQIVSADYTFYDPDSIWYKPNAAYTGPDSVTYCAIDSSGRSNINSVSITVADPASYPIPVGMPALTFGLTDTPPADPFEWPSGANANSYYIDSDHVSCSDATNGYPDQPRCSLPPSGTVVAAGSKIVLAGSVNDYPLRAGLSWHSLDLNGTLANPVWIVGDSDDAIKPKIVKDPSQPFGEFRVYGSYVRVDGVDFDTTYFRHMDSADSNIVIRNSIVRNQTRTVGAAINIQNDQVLILNSAIFKNGVIENDISSENDVHGIVVTTATNFYALDVLAYKNAGDSFQISNTAGSQNVYAGRFISHGDMENCFDFKTFDSVVVTTSDCYDLRVVEYSSSRGLAQAFYVNDEGPQQNYAYFLNNRCWDVAGACFGAANIDLSKVYFLGNVSLWNPTADCINNGGGTAERHYTLNTCANVNIGINNYTANLSTERYIVGNLLYGTTDADLRFTAFDNLITLADYNAMIDNPGIYKYGTNNPPEDTTIASSLADFKTQTGTCTNCADARTVTFTDAATYDFSITGGTIVDFVPASIFGTGAGQDDALSDLNSDLGVTLSDLLGTVRPQNTNYDAGAYEDAP